MLIALSAVTMVVLLGTASGARSRAVAGFGAGKRCPVWFDGAPALGPGRPRAVRIKGLTQVTVCRYLHAFGGGAVVHHPPLKTNLVSEGSLVDARALKSLALEVDRLKPLKRPPHGELFCGNEGSGGFYLLFSHRDGRRESVVAKPSGCRFVVAGRHGRVTFLSNRLQQRLIRIAPPYHQVH